MELVIGKEYIIRKNEKAELAYIEETQNENKRCLFVTKIGTTLGAVWRTSYELKKLNNEPQKAAHALFKARGNGQFFIPDFLFDSLELAKTFARETGADLRQFPASKPDANGWHSLEQATEEIPTT